MNHKAYCPGAGQGKERKAHESILGMKNRNIMTDKDLKKTRREYYGGTLCQLN